MHDEREKVARQVIDLTCLAASLVQEEGSAAGHGELFAITPERIANITIGQLLKKGLDEIDTCSVMSSCSNLGLDPARMIAATVGQIVQSFKESSLAQSYFEMVVSFAIAIDSVGGSIMPRDTNSFRNITFAEMVNHFAPNRIRFSVKPKG